MNTSIREPVTYYYDKYGKEYKMMKQHKYHMWCIYKIHIDIDNKKYGLKTYNKQYKTK